MKTDLIIKRNLAIDMLLNFCKNHKKNKNNIFTAYTSICETDVFNDTLTADILFSICDESYDYILNRVRSTSNQKVLLNIFSGSGRLMQELMRQNLLEKFETIYNIDSSKQMIEFEKKKFTNDKFVFLCENILDIKSNVLKYNLALCHCGVRYIIPEHYATLIDVLINLKDNSESRCVVSEVDDRFIEIFKKELKWKNINFESEKVNIKMQRNTTLYLSLLFYKMNTNFQRLINELATAENIMVGEILKEIAGYKFSNMNILIF